MINLSPTLVMFLFIQIMQKCQNQFFMRSKKYYLTKEQLQTIKEDRNAGTCMKIWQQTVKLNQITDNVFFDTDGQFFIK